MRRQTGRGGTSTSAPFVFGPALAIARIPAPVKRSSGLISSSLYFVSIRKPAAAKTRIECSQFLAIDARPSSSGAGGITTLGHEVRYYPVPHDPIVISPFSEFREVLACLNGEMIGVETRESESRSEQSGSGENQTGDFDGPKP